MNDCFNVLLKKVNFGSKNSPVKLNAPKAKSCRAKAHDQHSFKLKKQPTLSPDGWILVPMSEFWNK